MASFRKRGCKCEDKCRCNATWEFQAYVGIDPDTGKRIRKTFSGYRTKKEAELAAKELEQQVANKEFILKKVAFKDFIKQWVDVKKLTIKANTLAVYEGLINNHILPELGNEYMGDITPSRIIALYTKARNEKKLSDSTVRDIHKVLKNAFALAANPSWKIISHNPMDGVTPPKVEEQEVQTWTLEESNLFLSTAKNHKRSGRLYIAFLLALTTGMRQGEILGLRWKDINFQSQTISIVQTLSHDGKELTAGAKTSSGKRVISIDENTVAELESHRKKYINAEKMKRGADYPKHDLVVPTSTGEPLTPRNLMRAFYSLLDKVNEEQEKHSRPKLPKISFHDLRHTHATLLLKNNVNIKVVSERLGHSSTTITSNLYSHVTPDIQRDAAKIFGDMFYKGG